MTTNVQTEVRTLCVNVWGSPVGLEVIKNLTDLYRILIWESRIMIDLISSNEKTLGWADYEKLQVSKEYVANLSKISSKSRQESSPLIETKVFLLN